MGADVEGAPKKVPYPKSILFIIICEFCERFCYYGMRTILTLYFVQVLAWDENTATVIYHVYVLFSYVTPLLGAILSDSWLGKFQTILYLGIVYCIGCVVLTLAATPPLKIPDVAFSLLGLGLIALGTGGIKPCVSAFGADQFKLPEQEVQVASFFALFYFAINSGSLVSTALTPILREDVKCFGEDHCYSLAFAVPGALMIFALFIFVIGRPMYKIVKPSGNIVVQVVGAVKYALTNKGKAAVKRDHWMDYAEDKYGKRFVSEAKVLLKVLFLYIPLPFFWALFDQQGSRWTLQATRMDGKTGGWTIKPDQLQIFNPLLVLAFIPLFDRGVYPLLSKMGLLTKPLQRLTVGGIFAGIAFIISGIVELALEATYATELKSGESNLHMMNALGNCPVHVRLADMKVIEPNELLIYEAIESKVYENVLFETKVGDKGCDRDSSTNFTINAKTKEATSYLVLWDQKDKSQLKVYDIKDPDDMEKAKSGNPRMRIIYDPENIPFNTTLRGHGEKHAFDFDLSDGTGYTSFAELDSSEYDLHMSTKDAPEGFTFSTKLNPKLGGVYVMTLVRTGEGPEGEDNYVWTMHQITKENNVHMLLLLPQYIVMSAGEIMFSITIMDFSYAEGPPSMKAVMQSAWLLTVAVGNLIVVIIAEAQIFDKQWKEFFLFAGLMFLDMAVFAFMAYKYEPADRFWLDDHKKKKSEDPAAAEVEDENENDDKAKALEGEEREDNASFKQD